MKSIKAKSKTDVPYYKNWQFYVLTPAVLICFLSPILSLATGSGFNSSVIFMILVFAYLYYACSQTIRSNEMKRPTVIFALLIAIFIDAAFAFGIITAFIDK